MVPIYPIYIIIFLMSAVAMQGCATMEPRNAVPIDFAGKVAISGMPDIRTNIDDPNPIAMRKSLIDSFRKIGVWATPGLMDTLIRRQLLIRPSLV